MRLDYDRCLLLQQQDFVGVAAGTARRLRRAATLGNWAFDALYPRRPAPALLMGFYLRCTRDWFRLHLGDDRGWQVRNNRLTGHGFQLRLSLENCRWLLLARQAGRWQVCDISPLGLMGCWQHIRAAKRDGD